MYSVPAIELHFWVATIGIVLYIAAMWIAGVMQGLMWRGINGDGTLTYTFVESVNRGATDSARPWCTLPGPSRRSISARSTTFTSRPGRVAPARRPRASAVASSRWQLRRGLASAASTAWRPYSHRPLAGAGSAGRRDAPPRLRGGFPMGSSHAARQGFARRLTSDQQ
jgi:hypothetical protein